MKNFLNKLIAIGLIGFVLLYLFVFNKKLPENSLPELQEALISGEAFDINQLSGNIILLDFWGSWCAPCRRENPKISQLYNKYHNANFQNATNFEVVSVAIERDASRVENAIEKDGMVWPYHIVQESKILLASALARKFGVTDLPTKFLYDESGKLLGKNMSLAEIDRYLASQLSN